MLVAMGHFQTITQYATLFQLYHLDLTKNLAMIKSSPAIDGGTAVSAPADDYDGR